MTIDCFARKGRDYQVVRDFSTFGDFQASKDHRSRSDGYDGYDGTLPWRLALRKKLV